MGLVLQSVGSQSPLRGDPLCGGGGGSSSSSSSSGGGGGGGNNWLEEMGHSHRGSTAR